VQCFLTLVDNHSPRLSVCHLQVPKEQRDNYCIIPPGAPSCCWQPFNGTECIIPLVDNHSITLSVIHPRVGPKGGARGLLHYPPPQAAAGSHAVHHTACRQSLNHPVCNSLIIHPRVGPKRGTRGLLHHPPPQAAAGRPGASPCEDTAWPAATKCHRRPADQPTQPRHQPHGRNLEDVPWLRPNKHPLDHHRASQVGSTGWDMPVLHHAAPCQQAADPYQVLPKQPLPHPKLCCCGNAADVASVKRTQNGSSSLAVGFCSVRRVAIRVVKAGMVRM
jgi:hypothetical protein